MYKLNSSLILFCIAACLLSGCSSSDYSTYKKNLPDTETQHPGTFTSSDNSGNPQKSEPASALFIPWQVWGKGLTAGRIEFRDPRVGSADQSLSESDFRAALNGYRASRAVGEDELESLALRIASVELLSGDAPRSVLSLSKFFQVRKTKESDVSDASALFFAYAYGQSRNFEQSIAWFAQALHSGQEEVRSKASMGLRGVLRIIPSISFEEMVFLWKSHEAVATLIAEERALRQSRPVVVLPSMAFFWDISENSKLTAEQTKTNSALFPGSQHGRKVGVLLPLSGRYAKMGESIRKGLELAAELSNARGTALNLDFRDFASTSPEAADSAVPSGTALVADLAAQGASVIVGPLLSEQSAEIAESARRNSLPAIILAKGGNAILGDGVYRFGLTNESQAVSLVASIMRYRSNPRIALVYPNDETGLGFISAVRTAFSEFNISAIYDLSYSKGNSSEMLNHISALEINPPEFVIFGDNLKAAVQFFGAFSPSARKSIIPVGSALWDNPIEIMQSKTILSGAIYVSPFYPDLGRPLISEFVARYKEKNGKTPDFFAAQGYDTGLLLASSPGTESGSFRLPDFIEGTSGTARPSSYGEVLRDLSVLRLAHGTIAPISEIPQKRTISSLDEEPAENNSGSEGIIVPPTENTDPTIGQ